MSEILQGALIAGVFTVLGTLLGFLGTAWVEERKAERERLRELHMRLVGGRIQTSELIDFIRSRRKRKWPLFWKLDPPDLSGTNLCKVNLTGVNLRKADLQRARLDGASLMGADLSSASLFSAELSGAQMLKADLSDANLMRANLAEANLLEANLTRALLLEANLTGALLAEADLTEADLFAADLTRVLYDDATRWPNGFTPPPEAIKVEKSRIPPNGSTPLTGPDRSE